MKRAEWKAYEESQIPGLPPVALPSCDREPDLFPWETWDQYVEQCENTSLVNRAHACAAEHTDIVPAMPTVPIQSSTSVHREKLGQRILSFNALVARSVGKAEIRRTPEAQAALKKEWGKLVDQKVRDASTVCEWRDAAAKARKDGVEAQFGHIFAICVEKNSELPKGDPYCKFEGRAVFQGNHVVNQDWLEASFQDLGSALAGLEASRWADAYGRLEGHDAQIADAVQAYIQVELKGNPCWVAIPPEAWPSEWVGKY